MRAIDRDQAEFERRLAREQAAGFRARMTAPIVFYEVNEGDPPWRPTIVPDRKPRDASALAPLSD